MKVKYDFKKEWPKTKKKLMTLSQDALDLVKKGEEKLMQLSQEGKLRLDAGTLGLKKEQILYLIGKEYIKSKCPGDKSAKMNKLISELNGVERKIKVLNTKIKKAAKARSK